MWNPFKDFSWSHHTAFENPVPKSLRIIPNEGNWFTKGAGIGIKSMFPQLNLPNTWFPDTPNPFKHRTREYEWGQIAPSSWFDIAAILPFAGPGSKVAGKVLSKYPMKSTIAAGVGIPAIFGIKSIPYDKIKGKTVSGDEGVGEHLIYKVPPSTSSQESATFGASFTPPNYFRYSPKDYTAQAKAFADEVINAQLSQINRARRSAKQGYRNELGSIGSAYGTQRQYTKGLTKQSRAADAALAKMGEEGTRRAVSDVVGATHGVTDLAALPPEFASEIDAAIAKEAERARMGAADVNKLATGQAGAGSDYMDVLAATAAEQEPLDIRESGREYRKSMKDFGEAAAAAEATRPELEQNFIDKMTERDINAFNANLAGNQLSAEYMKMLAATQGGGIDPSDAVSAIRSMDKNVNAARNTTITQVDPKYGEEHQYSPYQTSGPKNKEFYDASKYALYLYDQYMKARQSGDFNAIQEAYGQYMNAHSILKSMFDTANFVDATKD